jgi:hypothetical protein
MRSGRNKGQLSQRDSSRRMNSNRSNKSSNRSHGNGKKMMNPIREEDEEVLDLKFKEE